MHTQTVLELNFNHQHSLQLFRNYSVTVQNFWQQLSFKNNFAEMSKQDYVYQVFVQISYEPLKITFVLLVLVMPKCKFLYFFFFNSFI